MDLEGIRRELEQRRDETRRRVAGLARRPQLGEAQDFGKLIGDGTVEAISRLTEIGVGTTLESGLERTERALSKLDEGTYGCATCAGSRSRRSGKAETDCTQRGLCPRSGCVRA